MESSAPQSTTKHEMTIREFQQLIKQRFGHKDSSRGVDATFLWFVEEVGELASAVRNPEANDLDGEFADVFAWLVTLANIKNIDLTDVVTRKYASGCPRCQKLTCSCQTKP